MTLAVALLLQALPGFREQVLDEKRGDIWAMALADVDADGKTDVLVLTWDKPAQVVWYQNPGPSTPLGASWKRRVIIADDPRLLVAIQPLDVDGDGKTELILGAEYHEPLDTTRGGTIWLLRRPDDLEKRWTPVKIGAEPTLHRIHTLDGKDLVCSSLGAGKKSAELFVLRRPADPFKDPWPREGISSELHTMHNTLSVDMDGDGKQEVIAAAREGLVLFQKTGGGWEKQSLSPGFEGNRGSSEIAVGRLPGGKRYLAAIEPHHGHEFVVYTESDAGWNRKVLHVNKGGHTLWPADFTRTGVDSMAVGFVGQYSNHPGGPCWWVFHPLDADGDKWEKKLIDDQGITGEDGACADLDGDGRVDLVAAGGSAVKIYWNEGK